MSLVDHFSNICICGHLNREYSTYPDIHQVTKATIVLEAIFGSNMLSFCWTQPIWTYTWIAHNENTLNQGASTRIWDTEHMGRYAQHITSHFAEGCCREGIQLLDEPRYEESVGPDCCFEPNTFFFGAPGKANDEDGTCGFSELVPTL